MSASRRFRGEKVYLRGGNAAIEAVRREKTRGAEGNAKKKRDARVEIEIDTRIVSARRGGCDARMSCGRGSGEPRASSEKRVGSASSTEGCASLPCERLYDDIVYKACSVWHPLVKRKR